MWKNEERKKRSRMNKETKNTDTNNKVIETTTILIQVIKMSVFFTPIVFLISGFLFLYSLLFLLFLLICPSPSSPPPPPTGWKSTCRTFPCTVPRAASASPSCSSCWWLWGPGCCWVWSVSLTVAQCPFGTGKPRGNIFLKHECVNLQGDVDVLHTYLTNCAFFCSTFTFL